MSLACVFLELAVSIVVMTALGRAFNLPPKLTSLLSIGASVCGVSAIIAARGAIDADDEDAAYAIAAILALGAVSLVVFPLIGHSLGMSDWAYGLWVGLAVDNTAERGTVSTDARRDPAMRIVAYIPGLSRKSPFGSTTRIRTVRVSGLSVG